MVTKHRHAWRTTAFWMLTLPDCDGYYEAFISWQCASCHQPCWSTGYFHQTAQAMSPDVWEQVAADERRAGGALASAAKQQERVHVAAQTKHTIRDIFSQEHKYGPIAQRTAD